MNPEGYVRLLPDPSRLPPDLVQLPRWITWDLLSDGRKMPKQKVNDPKSWLTLTEALANPGTGGIGFVFSEVDDIGGVDLDACRDPETGTLEPWAQQIVSMMDSYTEISPSGTGVKIFSKGAPPQLPAHVIPMQEGAKQFGDKKPQVEAYVSGRFFAVTGNALPGIDPTLPLGVAASSWLKLTELLSATRVMSGSKRAPRHTEGADVEVLPKGGSRIASGSRNSSLIRLGGILRNKGMSQEAITAALLAENEKSCDPPLGRQEVLEISRSAFKYIPKEDMGSPFVGRIPPNSQYHMGIALDRLDVSLSYNTFTDEPMITYPKRLFGGEDMTMVTEVLDDAHRRRIYFVLERDFFVKSSMNILNDFLQDKCQDRPYHPVRDYLNTLKWDGVPRLDTWLETYMGVNPENEDLRRYVRTVGAFTLMGAIRRIKQPGCKFDSMLIFEGVQNLGKSLAIATLSPHEDYVLGDFSLGTDAKVAIERTSGKWLVEISELVTSKTADVNKVKAFLTLTHDVARKAYGHKTTRQPRAFIFIGTTNELSYLVAADGNRRYWPVYCGAKVDIAGLKAVRDQLWAEAQEREPGQKLFLPEDLYEIAVKEQSARETIDPWQERLESLCGDCAGWWRLDSIWGRLDKPIGQTSSFDSRRLSGILHRMGFKSQSRYIKRLQRAIRVWARMKGSETDAALLPAILSEDESWEQGNDQPQIYNSQQKFV